jgi:hypothetical protein
MFARIILILAMALGLAAAPAWTGESCDAANEMVCGCCPETAVSCCVSTPVEPERRNPVQGVASSHELKHAIAPVLFLLGLAPEPAAAGVYGAVGYKAAQTGSGRLIDRICIRLI